MTETQKSLLQNADDALSRPGAWWVVASNAIPVIGVLLFGWSAFPLLVFYWIENVVVGAFNVLKILISGFTKSGAALYWAVPMAVFFTLHYGIFCIVHGYVLIGMLTIAEITMTNVEPDSHAFELLPRVMKALVEDQDLAWSVVGLIAIQLGAFILLWLWSGKWRESDPVRQVFEPYGRVIVLHLTLFFAAIPVVLIGQPQFAVFMLAVMKSGLELGLPHFGVDPEIGITGDRSKKPGQ